MFRTIISCILICMPTFAQERPPDIHLNHAYIVPDVQTYETVRNSEFLKNFAVVEERTTHRKDKTYSGFYVYGTNTYFEFLKADKENKPGEFKIALGVDENGGIDRIRKNAETAGIATNVQEVTRQWNGKDVNWFKSLEEKCNSKDSCDFHLWVLEYQPSFLQDWNPKRGEAAGVRRGEVLKRYADVLGQEQAEKSMLDIVGITLNLPAIALDESQHRCRVLGMTVNSIDGRWICSRKDFVLVLLPAKKPELVSLTVKLRNKKNFQKIVLGSTELVLNGDTGTWWMVPQHHD